METRDTPMTNNLFRQLQQDMAILDESILNIVVSPSSIHANCDGTYSIVGNADELKLTPSARRQLAQHLNIPHEYFISCPPHLQAVNSNHWLTLNNESAWAVRINDTKIQGFNFQGLIPFSRTQLVGLLAFLETKHPFETLSYQLQTDALDIRLFFPDEQHSVGILGSGLPDLVCPGLHLQCNETGTSILSLHGLVYRLVCENGLLPPPREVFFRHYTSADSANLMDLLQQDLESARLVAGESIWRMRKATNIKIKDPVGYIVAQATRRFTKGFVREAVDAFATEGAASTLYCVVNAFTRAAQRYPVQERLQIESFAGELLAS
jgi:hypothetical protein